MITFNFDFLISYTPFEAQGHKVPHLKPRGYGKYDTIGLSCGNTFSICQDVLKSDNLQHSQMKTTVSTLLALMNLSTNLFVLEKNSNPRDL